MGRRHREASPKKKKGGLLMGLRGGIQSAAKKVSGSGEAAVPSKRAKRFWDVVWALVLLAAAVVLLRRFGVIRFF